jgi:formyl-CoA transferase
MGAFAVQTALYRRETDPDFDGEWIDMALFEGLYRLCEWQVIVADQTGISPMRSGNQLANAPAAVINMYRSKDDRWITVTTGTWRSVLNVVRMLGEPESEYDSPEKQYGTGPHLDALLRDYIAERTAEEALATMEEGDVVASLIYDVEAILADPTYAEREAVITVDDRDLGPVRMQSVIPKMASHGGRVWRTGPRLGEDNELVYKGYLGMTENEYRGLVDGGTV